MIDGTRENKTTASESIHSFEMEYMLKLVLLLTAILISLTTSTRL